MNKTTHPSPPAWAERFLEWFCTPELLEDLQGDLHEDCLKETFYRTANAKWSLLIPSNKSFIHS